MADKTIIRHPIHTFQTYISREGRLPPPGKSWNARLRLATNSFRTVEEGFRSRYISVSCGRVSYIWYFYNPLPQGSLATSVVDMDAFLVGSSGGVYALLSAHLANVMLVCIL